MKNKIAAFSLTTIISVPALFSQEAKKPNFVFFMAEDLTKDCFEIYNGSNGATTPFLLEMSKQGVVFENAYCSSPVSSAARSTLITGVYAPSIGVSFHRKIKQVALPEGVNMFPTYLRDIGYHTSNASKTDYNCMLDENAWTLIKGKMGDWRKRSDKNTPFFHCFSIAACHESSLHFAEDNIEKVPTQHDPNDVKLYPHHPDTELFRHTYATLYDRINHVDKALGKLFDMLEEDNLLEDTFVFYFGDNGGCLPFSKGYTNEKGLSIPLVVYVPKNWKDKVPFDIGSRTGSFVSFMDFGATLLNLADVEVPEHIDGKAFLGNGIDAKEVENRNVVFGYGDRYDELYAMNRTVRKGDFKYSRNFMPYQPKGLYCFYRYKQAAFRQWREMYKDGDLNSTQSQFFQPQQAEELYDLSNDPHETINLAQNPEYLKKLKELRDLVKNNMLEKKDLGLIPESVWAFDHHMDLAEYTSSDECKISEYSKVIDMQLRPFTKIKRQLAKALKSEDLIERYWAATVCCSFGIEAAPLKREMTELLKDSSAIVKSRATIYMAQNHFADPLPLFKEALNSVSNGIESLMILNDATYIKDSGLGYEINFDKEDVKMEVTAVDKRLDYLK